MPKVSSVSCHVSHRSGGKTSCATTSTRALLAIMYSSVTKLPSLRLTRAAKKSATPASRAESRPKATMDRCMTRSSLAGATRQVSTAKMGLVAKKQTSQFPSFPSFSLVPKLCLGTHLRETPVSRSRGYFAACAKRSFADSAFPNRVWERGRRETRRKGAFREESGRIDPAAAEGVAAAHPPHALARAANRAVLVHREDEVLATTRVEPAHLGQQ